MLPRQPRLGDILDDYCPRERRVTNHAVVAMVGEEIKQTRCTTCDAEHEYKKAKVPAQRKKKQGATALYDEVLTGMPRKLAPVSHAAPPPGVPEDEVDLPEASPMPAPVPEPVAAAAAPVGNPEAAPVAHEEFEGPVHRPLIRATLPRPEGQAKERPIPEFTARAVASRPGRFRPHGAHAGPHGGGQARGPGGGNHAARFGRRGQGPGPFATAGAPSHGNRAGGHNDRQGGRRRGGKRSK
jgi:hypothetical protein